MLRPSSVPVIVGLGGSVAVGKSTLAAAVVEELSTLFRCEAAVIGTDGFLFSNAELETRGLLSRKGEPQTYDEASLLKVVADMRAGCSPLWVPTYSHRTFDVGPPTSVPIGDVIVFEGVNALQPGLLGAYDLAIYLDANATVIRTWFIERFLGLVAAAEGDTDSYYRRFVDQSADTRRTTARWVWDTINAPNLDRFVAPTKAAAHLVVHLDANHALVAVDPG